MKTRSVIALMSTTLLAAGVISASTATAGHSPHPSSKLEPVFSLTAKQTTGTFLDLNKKGSQGDEFLFTEALFFKGQGQVGRDSGVCTQTTKNVSQCVVTATFKAVTKAGVIGTTTLTAQGLRDQRHAHDTFTVTGGSGEFEGVAGQVEVIGISNTKTLLAFDFVQQPVVTVKAFN
jgi:hypothetical protein